MASHLNLDLIAVQLNDSSARDLRAVSCGEAGSHQPRIPAQITFVPNKERVDSLGCIFTALSCDRRVSRPVVTIGSAGMTRPHLVPVAPGSRPVPEGSRLLLPSGRVTC